MALLDRYWILLLLILPSLFSLILSLHSLSFIIYMKSHLFCGSDEGRYNIPGLYLKRTKTQILTLCHLLFHKNLDSTFLSLPSTTLLSLPPLIVSHALPRLSSSIYLQSQPPLPPHLFDTSSLPQLPPLPAPPPAVAAAAAARESGSL